MKLSLGRRLHLRCLSVKNQELKMKHQLGFGLRKISRLSDMDVTPYSNSFPGRSCVKCSSSKLVKYNCRLPFLPMFLDETFI